MNGTVSINGQEIPAIIRPAAPADSLQAITAVTLRTMSEVNRKKEEIRMRKESVKNALDNDQNYSAVKEEWVNIGKSLKEQKLRVIQENKLENYIAETKDLESELKDGQLTLFNHIDSYRKASGQDSIEDEDGNVLKLTAKYKITKRG